MEILLNNTLVLSEDLIAHCVKETLASACIDVGRIPEDQIDSDMPLRWAIFMTVPNNSKINRAR